MTGDQWGIVGLITSLILGVPALIFGAKKILNRNQNQRIDRGGTGYQAGGDINIGDK